MTSMKEIKFGIEIETVRLGKEATARAIADGMPGWQLVSRGYQQRVLDTDGREWKVVTDGSLNYNGAEIVSPILKYDDIETLQQVVRVVRRAGAKVDASCGIHIHVDAAAFDVKAIVRLAKLWFRKEEMLKHALEVIRSRGDHYAWNMDKYGFMSRLLGRSRAPKTLDELNKLWYDRREVYDARRHNDHYNRSRYHALNLHNVWYRGTVEFRVFNSVLHAGKVKAYVQFCLALAAKAINARSASANRGYAFDPNNARYELWWFLHELGLNGDEFKTCRTHLTKHLSGTSKKRNESEAERRERLERARARREGRRLGEQHAAAMREAA